KWLLPQLKPEQRWYGLEQDEGALGRSIERSQQFLLLSALLTLLLAVAAVAVAMNHYCRSRYDLVAILKTLGAGRAQLRKLIVGQWLMVLVLSALTCAWQGSASIRKSVIDTAFANRSCCIVSGSRKVTAMPNNIMS
ncbi:FtsX-like permease family protein, partial [Pseudomonas aeruginosa]|uniref:FtsX-like permease family protein n=1 Tax=Pseudomonas aeruginosa TaxID=287 RepID=UPI0031B6E579